jgi:glycosyltransferase involved in cell wall biosynthesis
VACSDVSSLPEVAGEAALYFDPYDAEAIFDSLRRLLSSDDLRHHLRHRGLERAAGFSWQQVAVETKAVYEAVLGGMGGSNGT